jgi:hypothetical protein
MILFNRIHYIRYTLYIYKYILTITDMNILSLINLYLLVITY